MPVAVERLFSGLDAERIFLFAYVARNEATEDRGSCGHRGRQHVAIVGVGQVEILDATLATGDGRIRTPSSLIRGQVAGR